jgi:hypothetical protein
MKIASVLLAGLIGTTLLLRGEDKHVEVDRFGIAKQFPTRAQGREWFCAWGNKRSVSPYQDDTTDPLFHNEDGTLQIGEGIAKAKAGQTRLVVMTPSKSAGATIPPWRNVEMTVYVRRGSLARKLDYQAFYLSARSGVRHNDDVPCEGTSYHATARFDGQWGFKKEIWHTGGYTELRPNPTPKPWETAPENAWVGMKFVCRNYDKDRKVLLQLYYDAQEKNDWKLVAEYRDTGDWKGEKPGCSQPQNKIITSSRPAVYFRTDYVDVDLKKFSVREIDPLP